MTTEEEKKAAAEISIAAAEVVAAKELCGEALLASTARDLAPGRVGGKRPRKELRDKLGKFQNPKAAVNQGFEIMRLQFLPIHPPPHPPHTHHQTSQASVARSKRR